MDLIEVVMKFYLVSCEKLKESHQSVHVGTGR